MEHQDRLTDSKFEQIKLLLTSLYLRIRVLFLTLQCGILFMKYLVSFTNPGIS